MSLGEINEWRAPDDESRMRLSEQYRNRCYSDGVAANGGSITSGEEDRMTYCLSNPSATDFVGKPELESIYG
jgi:hypothetical protein